MREDPATSARRCGLIFGSDQEPGIRRARHGRGFIYRKPDGKILRDPRTLQRIEALVIPPAWKDVWIAPHPRSHLQATGRDERGRKQHLYHPEWRIWRDRQKYNRLAAFAQCLCRLRSRVQRDLRQPGLPRTKVLATVVRLLQTTLIRVGNDEYARTNNSYGLTTLRDQHAKIRGGKMRFEFKGKSGVHHAIDLCDRRLAKIVKACQDLPGQELFQYVDDRGRQRKVRSNDVNAYLREVTGEDFTAKDVRTWAGTVLAAVTLRDCAPCTSATQLKKNLVQAIACVAARLGNTRTVCRRCYIHPAILDAYLAGDLSSVFAPKRPSGRPMRHLTLDEVAVFHFLKSANKSSVVQQRG
jgi:DNA topoisomerase-1